MDDWGTAILVLGVVVVLHLIQWYDRRSRRYRRR